MNPRISLEILGEGFGTDVLDHKILKAGPIQFELALIGRKDQASFRRQNGHRRPNHPDVIALNIQGSSHPLGGREGRRIQEDQIKPLGVLGGLFKPAQTIGAEESV